jgi:phosphatidylglycerophosphatase A
MGFPIATDAHARRPLAGPADVVARWIAVVGGCGYAPFAPGTVGSLVAVVAFVGVTTGLHAADVAASVALAIHAGIVLALCGVGTWAAGRAERSFGRHDDGRIVIDEVAGQWIALLPAALLPAALLPAAALSGASGRLTTGGAGEALSDPTPFVFFLAVVTGFVLFRVFDVWKPGWIRWVERRFDGGFGVMADDLVAGVHAAVLLALAIALLIPALSVPALPSSASTPGGVDAVGGARA